MLAPQKLFVRLSVLAIVAVSSSVHADQRDARLPQLFERLRATSNASEGLLFAHLIGEVWLETENPRIRKPFERALEALKTHDLALASRLFDQIVRDAPKFAEGWNKRAEVQFLIGNFDASMHDSEQTLALEPRHFEAYFRLGLICERLNDPVCAVRHFERALFIYPHIPNLKRHVTELQDQLAGKNA